MPQSEQVPLYCAVPHPFDDPSQDTSSEARARTGCGQVGSLSHKRTDLGLTEYETSRLIESGQTRSDEISAALTLVRLLPRGD